MRSLNFRRFRKGIESRYRNLQPNIRAAKKWRGQNPRIYLHNMVLHPVWDTYLTHPPLTYSPSFVAELCHWVNVHTPGLRKPHVFEVEHIAALANYESGRFMADWSQAFDDRETIEGKISSQQCRKVFTFSNGLLDHCRQHLDPTLWHKLDYVYPAFPFQPNVLLAPDRPFHLLVIASRFSDKGLPEAIEAFRVLRSRHGSAIEMTLVTQSLPENYRLSDGITVTPIPRLSVEQKDQLYRSADVLLLPCYSETAACFAEASAYAVPIVTTRIHHGEEFVREGFNGFLVDPPLYCYGEGFATRWRTWEDFLQAVIEVRERGGFASLVDQLVDRIEILVSGGVDLAKMRGAALLLHRERFSPEIRNQKLLQIYSEALGK